ncbi:MAG: hypothetical protein DRH30_03250 [Deltaproteobacteria bacterium]|nr:MAG: hypothetical protein DRH30_03250 [Deltaproteobacteria bacterium]
MANLLFTAGVTLASVALAMVVIPGDLNMFHFTAASIVILMLSYVQRLRETKRADKMIDGIASILQAGADSSLNRQTNGGHRVTRIGEHTWKLAHPSKPDKFFASEYAAQVEMHKRERS